MGIWPGHWGYTLLFSRSAMGFLMTTESQDLGLTSLPKDGIALQYFHIQEYIFYICIMASFL